MEHIRRKGMMNLADKENLISILPKRYHDSIDDEFVYEFSTMEEDTLVPYEYLEEMYATNINILEEVRGANPRKLLEAVKFVSVYIRTNSMEEAFKIVYPAKYKELLDTISAKDINAYARSIYNRKIVQKLIEYTNTALHVQYAGLRHEAILHQANLMRGKANVSWIPKKKKNPDTGKLEEVIDSFGNVVLEPVHMVVTPTIQQLASKTILELTKLPETQKHQISVGIDSGTIEVQKATADALDGLAKSMYLQLQQGGSINEVQKIGHVISTEVIEHD